MVGATAWLVIAAHVERKREWDAVTRAMRDQTEAANARTRWEAEFAQLIEDMSDTRDEGGFDAEQARMARQRGLRLLEKAPYLWVESAAKAVVFGGDRTMDELEKVGVAIQTGRLDIEWPVEGMAVQFYDRARDLERQRKELR